MYSSFKVKNFRGFESFEINNLSRVNLIAGLNNVGKTALLEALFLYGGAYNPALTININSLRGIETITVESASDKTPWDSYFYNFKIETQIELIGVDDVNRHRILKFKVARPSMEEISESIHLNRAGILSGKGQKLIGVNSTILELEFEETGKKKGKAILVVDGNGIRSQPDQRRRATYKSVSTSTLVSSLNSSIIPIAFRDFEFFSDKLRYSVLISLPNLTSTLSTLDRS